MTNFEKHLGKQLPQNIVDYLQSTPTQDLQRQAERLKFDSWCPVSIEGDSPEVRQNLKEASDLIFAYLKFTNS